MKWTRYLMVLVLALCAAKAADARSHTIRGRIVDAEGKGVAGLVVATAWTQTPKNLTPLGGARTNADGRFELAVDADEAGAVLLAMNGTGTKGALIHVASEHLTEEATATLETCIKVSGNLSVEAGKYYPSDACVWICATKPRSALLRFDLEKGTFAFALPPGRYEMTSQGLGRSPRPRTLELAAKAGEMKLGEIELADHKGRVATGAIAPPIRYTEATTGVHAALRTHHFPRKMTLCYFWASR